MNARIVLQPIEYSLIEERLKMENPWWVTGAIQPQFDQMKRRGFFNNFFKEVAMGDLNRAIVLLGPRRVGKSVMMQHAVARLLETGQSSQKILYIGVDNPVYLQLNPDQLFGYARQITGETDPAGWNVFFDEIQYVKDWERHLKVMVDTYPNTQFVVSGSAAAALRYKSVESGAGRFTDFQLPPLTFYEYLQMRDLEQLVRPAPVPDWSGNLQVFFQTNDLKELNRHFIDYIDAGGYPELLFSERMQQNPAKYLKSDILDKVLLRDLPTLYGIQHVRELHSFFSTLAYYSGNEVSLESLSKSSGVDKNLLKKYLEYLEAAFLIRVVHRIDETAKRFQRATFYKIYLTNPSLRSALFGTMDAFDDRFGNMVETTIFSQWMGQYHSMPVYARWHTARHQGEVDVVGLHKHLFKPAWALEIKWSNRFVEHLGELKSLLYFCEKQGLKEAMITTIDKQLVKELNGIKLVYVPASLYALAAGASLMATWGND